LEDGPPRFRQGSTCPVVLRYHPGRAWISSTGLSPALADLPRSFDYPHHVPCCRCRDSWMALQPDTYNAGRLAYVSFGLVPVRSPLLGESQLISFPKGTEMFQFPSLATPSLCIQLGLHRRSSMPVSRFGDPWIDARKRLPMAYRSFATSFFASWCQGIHRMLLLA
jgi:hypothetical protein